MPAGQRRRAVVRALYWAGIVVVIVGVAFRFALGYYPLGVGLAVIGLISIVVARVVAMGRR